MQGGISVMFIVTSEGMDKISNYIDDMYKEKAKVIQNKNDTCDEVSIPDMDDIIDDVEKERLGDESFKLGNFCYCYPITDNYEMSYSLELEYDVDFYERKSKK